MAKDKLMGAGGQAVIEGVMMRSKSNIAIAVRKPNGRINVKKQKFVSFSGRNKILGLPVVRGIVNLIEMMILGIKALNYSANQSLDEKDEISGIQIAISIILALAFAILVFKLIPLLFAQAMNYFFDAVKKYYLLFNLIDGVTRIILFFFYLYLISFMKDIRTLFKYHGAEHKTINCYEYYNGDKSRVTVENAQKFSTSHPRCGTSFILIVLVISIVVYSFIPKDYSFWLKFGSRLLLLPLVAGISYEALKFSGKYRNNRIVRVLIWPGMLVQRLATRQPTNKQVEVAIKALKSVV